MSTTFCMQLDINIPIPSWRKTQLSIISLSFTTKERTHLALCTKEWFLWKNLIYSSWALSKQHSSFKAAWRDKQSSHNELLTEISSSQVNPKWWLHSKQISKMYRKFIQMADITLKLPWVKTNSTPSSTLRSYRNSLGFPLMRNSKACTRT